jgi:hypothetical protein
MVTSWYLGLKQRKHWECATAQFGSGGVTPTRQEFLLLYKQFSAYPRWKRYVSTTAQRENHTEHM